MGEENIEERGVWKCSSEEDGKQITERGFQRTLSCGRIGRGKPDADLNRIASLWTSPLKMKKKNAFTFPSIQSLKISFLPLLNLIMHIYSLIFF